MRLKIALSCYLVSFSALATSDFTLSSSVEISAENSANLSGERHTNLKLDAFTLGSSIQITEALNALLEIKKEDFDHELEKDFHFEVVSFNWNTERGMLTAGRIVMPFSFGDTQMISDPTTYVEIDSNALSYTHTLNELDLTIYSAHPLEINHVINRITGLNVHYPISDSLDFDFNGLHYDSESAYAISLKGQHNSMSYRFATTRLTSAPKLAQSMGINHSNSHLHLEVVYQNKWGNWAYAHQRDGLKYRYNLISWNMDFNDHIFLISEYKKAQTESPVYTIQLSIEF